MSQSKNTTEDILNIYQEFIPIQQLHDVELDKWKLRITMRNHSGFVLIVWSSIA